MDFNSNRKIVEFDTLGVISGFTTRSMGNYHSRSPELPKIIQQVKNYCMADSAKLLIPIHDTNIHFVGNEKGDVFAPASDALVSIGRDESLASLVHCSRLTLAKDIIRNVLIGITSIRSDYLGKLRAFIFPGISAPMYEVSAEVRSQFLQDRYEPYFRRSREEDWLMDLAGIIRAELLHYEVSDQSIRTLSNFCSAQTRFIDDGFSDKFIGFSYRARSEKERNLVFVKHPQQRVVLGCNTGDCPVLILYT